ncbi:MULTISPECIES: ABC transporter substrate-binding protein [unclassified Parafrankia]|uniref:ABC transporter substrate-binding protein n=1 Tax=unclassified Parafrankia TaxID=2994368 RepID=UPI000DA45E61|nr:MULTISPECIES: ABC transporter substrate-binding protein [unclassified Parafrankia]TCJ30676.1 ABC transporter substrate-binding protein [Parafrankia sp. BMG5.11]CAI7979429.1 Trehalose transport system substrate-binding protein [Frankia sp. Hr75.2]SQD97462.1 Extracellular solute-binding protein family 1 [Parafrankia sp. Ea1.12]
MGALVLAAVLALGACGGSGDGAGRGPVRLTWYVYNESSGSFAKAAADCSAASNGRYTIGVNMLPNDSDGQRQQLVRRLAAEDSSMDILALDVTWTAEFAEAGWIVPFPAAEARRLTDGMLPAAVRTGTWENQLHAVPLNTNVQLLWYRKDLVPRPPRTWDEMLADARRLAEQGKPHHVEVQGAQYEGYTVLFNSLVASAGGQILNEDGTQVVLGTPAQRAVEAIRALAHSPAADPSWSNQREDDNRLAFETGSAAFQLNYPFIYPSARQNNPRLAEQIGWAQWPTLVPGQPSHSTIGGYNLAIGAYSPHRAAAAAAIACLTGRDNQIRDAIDGGLPPTLEDLYTDQEFIDGGYPFASAIYTALQNASVRPRTPAYQSVSLQIAHTLSPPSSASLGRLGQLRGAIADALESKGLVP